MKHYLQRLQDSVTENWDRKALCDFGGESFTYGEMAVNIEKFHILFRNLGIRKGDKIAICARNRARWAVAFLAADTYEVTLVPILPDFTPENICSIVKHSESILLFTDYDIWKSLDKSLMPSLRQAIRLSDFSMLFGSDTDRTSADGVVREFLARYPSGFYPRHVQYPAFNDKDPAVINYTSGSTGTPKGVMLRYECISANVEFAQNVIPAYPTDRLLSVLPMAHMFGLTFELIYPLCGGVTVYYLGKAPSPSLLMKAMKDVRPYLVIAVPMIFEKLYKNKLKPALDKPMMRFLTSIPGIRKLIFAKVRRSIDTAFGGKVREYIMGGAALNPEVEAFLRKIGLHFTVGYGMTEAGPLLAYSDWSNFSLRSCGRPMTFVDVRIDSEDPSSKVGEIQVKGVNIFSGYFKNEKASAACFTEDGWFRTGDLGLLDKDGNLYIKGRSKSMLLSSNGQNIYPEEIESEINNQPHVVESLVVSRDGKLVALVYPDESTLAGQNGDYEYFGNMILDAVNGKLPKFCRLSKVELEMKPFIKTPKLSIKRFLYS